MRTSRVVALLALAGSVAAPARAAPLLGSRDGAASSRSDRRLRGVHRTAAPVSSPSEAESPSWLERDRLGGNWGGLRGRLEERGIAAAGTFVGDWSGLLSGGLRKRDTVRFLLDVNAALDLWKLVGWSGATFFVDAYTQHGRVASNDVGDFQGFSNIDSENRTQLAELWLEQTFFDSRVRIKIGKVDANSEFAFVDAGGDFLSSSAGFSPTLFLFPTYPDPAMSANLFIYPTSSFYIGAAIYDGATHDGVPTGRRGPETFFSGSKSDDYFAIGEVGWMWKRSPIGGPGRIAAGPWMHTGRMDRFQGGTEKGSIGWFALIEHAVFDESPKDPDDEQGIAVFAQYGYSDPDVSAVHQHVGVGVVWNGAIPTRDCDSLGFMVSWVDLAGRAGIPSDETTFELFHRWQLAPFLSLWGDLQYIKNPFGSIDQRDALVATLRSEIAF